ncbi:MAG: diguanylate cyclase [Thermodesulfobacteriota bacterium]
MAEKKKRSLIRRIIRFITFVDLPIRKKFLLFSAGVLFWFLVLASVSFYALIDVNMKTSAMVKVLLPYERTANEILSKTYELERWVDDLESAQSEKRIAANAEKVRIILQGMNASLDEVNAGQPASPMRLLWKRLSKPTWLEEEQNKVFVEDIRTYVGDMLDTTTSYGFMRADAASGKSNEGLQGSRYINRLEDNLHRIKTQSVEFLDHISIQAKNYSHAITTTTSYAFWIVIGVLVLALGLLAVFTFWIADSIVKPVSAMIRKIHTLATGHVDLMDKIEVRSADEIGEMATQFNELMDTVHGMTVFKNVIEEDATLEDVYSRMGEAFQTNLEMENYRIYEVAEDFKTMKPVFPVTLSEKDLECNPEILNSCDLCRAVKTGHDISSLMYDRVCKQFIQSQDKVHVCIPMILGGHAGGVVQFVFDKPEQNGLTRAQIEQKVSKAEAYIKQSLSVIEAKRLMKTLHDSTLRDPMTGLFNRRFMQDQASHLIAMTLRRKKNIGLLMCDIDYFKQVNDKYGHDAGDTILKDCTSILSASVREADLVIRYGGEEFLIMLIDIEPGDSESVAEKVRKGVEEKGFNVNGEKIRKTISVGVSEFPHDTDAFWQAIKFADVALYQAKESGRNKVVRFEPHMWADDEF